MMLTANKFVPAYSMKAASQVWTWHSSHFTLQMIHITIPLNCTFIFQQLSCSKQNYKWEIKFRELEIHILTDEMFKYWYTVEFTITSWFNGFKGQILFWRSP